MLKYYSDYLIYSPVPILIARNAYKNIIKRKIKNIEIESSVLIPNDAELKPIVDLGKGNIKGLKIKKRTFSVKYDIMAITSNSVDVKNVIIKEINDKIIWQISTNNQEIFFDLINSKRISIEK